MTDAQAEKDKTSVFEDERHEEKLDRPLHAPRHVGCDPFFVETPSRALLCPLHGGVFRLGSAVIAACGHTFCRQCLSALPQSAVCPVCNRALGARDNVIDNIAVNEQVASLQVRCCFACTYESLMADEEGNLERAESGGEHHNHQHVLDPCGCQAIMKYADVEAHEELCPFQFVSCPFGRAGCPPVRLKDVDKHKDVCGRQRCPHAQEGCTYEGEYSEVKKHVEQECVYEKLSGFITKQHAHDEEVAARLQCQEEQLKQLSNMVDALSTRIDHSMAALEAKTIRLESCLRQIVALFEVTGNANNQFGLGTGQPSTVQPDPSPLSSRRPSRGSGIRARSSQMMSRSPLASNGSTVQPPPSLSVAPAPPPAPNPPSMAVASPTSYPDSSAAAALPPSPPPMSASIPTQVAAGTKNATSPGLSPSSPDAPVPTSASSSTTSTSSKAHLRLKAKNKKHAASSPKPVPEDTDADQFRLSQMAVAQADAAALALQNSLSIPQSGINCKGTFTGHTGPVWALVTTGTWLVSASSDARVKLWDLSDMKSVKCVATLKGHTDIVHCLAAIGNRIFSGSADKLIKVWDIETNECVATLPGLDSTVCSLAVGAGFLFSGSYQQIRVWDLETLELVKTLGGHNHWVRAMTTFGGYLYSGAHNTIKVWDLSTFTCVRSLKTHGGSIYALAVVDSKFLLCGTYENAIDVWEIEKYEHFRRLEGHTGAVYSLGVGQQNRFFSGSYDSSIKVWSTETWSCVQTVVRHTSSVDALCVFGPYLFSGSADHSIKLWADHSVA